MFFSYGIDLWGALASQTLEAEVNHWEDLKFLDTHFVNCLPEWNTRYLTPSLFEEELAAFTNTKLRKTEEKIVDLTNTINAYQIFNDLSNDDEYIKRNIEKSLDTTGCVISNFTSFLNAYCSSTN